MTAFLPHNLLTLFSARDPLPYVPPIEKRNPSNYSGVGDYLQNFDDDKDMPVPVRTETIKERRERRQREKAEQIAYKLEQDIALWEQTNTDNNFGDPFKTLFVARINYDTDESKLRREFENYGRINKVTMVKDQNGKPRGYAFIEYKHESDMLSAFKKGDGRKIDGKRVLVDVRRSGTVKGFMPRRLGMGLGGTRNEGEPNNPENVNPDERRNDERRNDDRNRDMRDCKRERSRSRDRKRERSRDRSPMKNRDRERRRSRDRKRSPEKDRKRSTERHRKRSSDRDIKKEPGEIGTDSSRKRSRRSRSRDRNRSPDKKRVKRSRSRGKDRVKPEVKHEVIDGGYGPYEGAPPAPSTFIKRE